VKQCTELGVTEILPVVCEKSHLKEYSETYLERLRRIALEAMKQSFQATLPDIDRPIAFEAFVTAIPDYDWSVVADLNAPPLRRDGPPGATVVIVGPEGGFTAEERQRLESAGAEFVSVSPNRLRAETAAVAMTTLLLADL
jgi:16S rRNA (uracil1498-N3)-methyltransferase